MKAVENWVRDIVFYMIFVTMVMNLLPDPKYEKYLRLFAGAVMILLAFDRYYGSRGWRRRWRESLKRSHLRMMSGR